ncbi:MAG: transcriptional regulator, partial [Sulfolobus sp.]|nr:transcriptional regulator [Sulfolobus sp.]
SLNKLLELGMTMRVKETGSKAGRPRYLYKAISMPELKAKILEETKRCLETLIKVVNDSLS